MKEILIKSLVVLSSLMWGSTFAVRIVAPEFRKFNLALLVISIVLSSLASFFYRRDLKIIFKSRFFKSGLVHGLNLVLLIGILGLINFLVVKNDRVFDVTRSKMHTLSNKTKSIIKMFGDEVVQFELFAYRNTWDRYANLLDLYKDENKNIQLKLYDIEKEISRARLYNIKEAGTLVVNYQNKQYKVVVKNEATVTTLLYKIFNPVKNKIYYSIGHNEISLFDKNQLGANFLRAKLLEEQFELQAVELQRGIPKDASAVMILNPQIEFLPQEIKSLEEYVKNGGNLVITLAPYFNGVVVKNFINFLNELGVNFYNGIILDRLATQQGSQASIPVVNQYTDHKITKGFLGRTLFPISSYFKTNNLEHVWTDLVKSTPFPGSWGETNFDEIKTGAAKYTELTDQEGPLTILSVGENKKSGSKILISGSTSFISNQYQGQTNNFNLFLNAMNWLGGQETLISLDRPGLKGDLVYISGIHLSFVFYFAILLMPFLFFGIGIYFYRKRLSS